MSKVNSYDWAFFWNHIILDLMPNAAVQIRKKTLKYSIVSFDNASLHNFPRSCRDLEAIRA
jgi:hypothetical protein